VWVKSHTGRFDDTLNGLISWQLQQVLQIKWLNVDAAFVGCWLALLFTPLPQNSENLDSVSKFDQVRKALAAIALHIFSVGNILGCAHVISELATSNDRGDRRNEEWIVIRHTSQATWNDVYDM
jgi:hypothetical protein